MNTDSALRPENTATDTTPTAKATARRGRRSLLGLAAAAALLLGGGITAGIAANSGNGHSTTAGASLNLTLPGSSAQGKCQAPVPDQLAGYPTLFYGTATSVKGPLVTFHVDHWLRGGGTHTVVVSSDPDFPESLTFTVGEHYIVAADKDGTIPSCGANWASDETWKEFRQALAN
ncbi:hypothetical protein ACFWPQ_21280 [Streptomyces sp. NPDC058464]|uniref:hypothetical protein n=1 Tax=Streptomyces sp. NPDC058464 TaxID=3346511 RepID=UPI0036676AE9